MTRSRTIISVFAALALGTLTAGPAFGALTASPNPSSTGSYTVSDASPPTLPEDVSTGFYETVNYYNLVETLPGGTTQSHSPSSGAVSWSFSNKTIGTYSYQLQTCVYTLQLDGEGFTETDECTNSGSSLSVSVISPPADLMPDFGTASVSSKSWTQNTAISAFTVPSATGGDTPLSYAATGLPAGVSMSSARSVSGTPTVTGTGTATVTVTDDDGDADTLEFTWTVEAPPVDLMPDFGDATLSDQSWTLNRYITHVNVPAATGGDGRLTYSGSELPAGVRFLTSTRVVLGRPTEAGSGTFTVTVTDEDGDTDTLSFDWTVIDPMPEFGDASVSDKSWTQNHAIAAFTVTAATGGNTPLSYTATDLPAGVTMSRFRRVSGTPTATGSGTATVTVTDDDGDTDTLEFDWTVGDDPMPSFDGRSVPDKTWTQDEAISTFYVPSATGGDTPLSYSIDGLPAGVTMSRFRRVSGTPTATGSGTATVTVTDDDGDTGTLEFDWTVDEEVDEDLMPDFGTASVSSKTWTQNTAITAFTVPSAMGGDTPLSYDADDLPAGVTMSSAREVSGAPTSPGSGTATVTVSDEDDDTATLSFTWTVDEDLMPTFGAVSVTDKSWTRNQVITAFTVPAATGGDAPLSYTATGLPAGVVMNETTRGVTGTPTAAGTGTATVTVTDRDGDTDTVTLEWSVSVPLAGGLRASPNPSSTGSYTVSDAAPPTLPENVTIGNPRRFYSYNLLETPPSGTANSYDLGRGPVSRSFSGQSAGTYVYQLQTCTLTLRITAGEGVEFTRCTDVGSSLSVTVTGTDPMPAFAVETLPARTWIDGIAIAAFDVPSATGGDAPLSYSIMGQPNGVTMSSARRVSGTPTAAGSGTATVTVTDDDGDTDTLTFAWAVEADTEPMFPSPGPSDKNWTQNAAITAFTVNAANGGNAPLTYSVRDLPAGVVMNETTRVVSGTPTAAGTGTATVTVTDDDGDTGTLTFDWTVTTPVVPQGQLSATPNPSATGNYTVSHPSPPALPADVVTADLQRYYSYNLVETPAMGEARSYDLARGPVSQAFTGKASDTYRYQLQTCVFTVERTEFDATDTTVCTDAASALSVTVDRLPAFAVEALDARTWIDGIAIAAFAVDAATDGDTPLSYAATGLPAGVTMSSTREVSGAPTGPGSGTATVTVTDEDGDTDTLTFAWAVEADTEPMFSTPVPAQTWSQDRAITAFTVDEASGGNAPLTYSVSDLPAGVVMNETTLVVSGMPTASGSDTATVTVTDADGDTATLQFDWTVPMIGSGGTGTHTDPYILSDPLQVSALDIFGRLRGTGGGNTAASATYFRFTVPEGRAGAWTVAVDGTPDSRADWNLRGDGGLRSVTSNADESAQVTLTAGQHYNFRVYPYLGTDRAVLTGLTLTLTAPASTGPVFPVDPLPARTWIDGIAIAAFTVDAATGGTSPLSYTATRLPAGVAMNVTTREVSGTPTAAGSGTATVTATDSNNATGTVTFEWTVEADTEPVFPSPGPSDKSWTQNAAITAFTVDEATGGNAPLTYTASDLPAGVVMNETTRVVSGTPTAAGAGTPTAAGAGTATVTVTDDDGDTGTLTFDWTVTIPVVPQGQLSATPNPSATGNYTVSHPSPPALPADVVTADLQRYYSYNLVETPAMGEARSYDLARGPVSQAFTGKASDTYRYQLQTCVFTVERTEFDATDTTVCTDAASALSVTVDRLPAFALEALDARTWIDGIAIAAFTVDAVTGGDTPLTYAATGLPAGVTMSSTREVSGAPTGPGSGSATVTVTDEDGDTDTLTFAWAVEADTEPMFSTPVPAQTWSQDRAIAAFTVDEASGGNDPLSYAAIGLPAGVDMDPQTRQVTGTPTAAGSDTATVTVTDADGDTATLQFDWTVPMIGSGGTGTHTDPYILSDPLQVSALDIFGRLRGTGGGNTAASATYFRFTVPEGRAGEWTVAMDGTPDSRADWDLRGDGGLRSVTSNADESAQVTLTAAQVYNFRVYPYLGTDRAVLTGLSLTLTAPASTGPVFPVDPLPARTWIDGIAIAAFAVDEATGGTPPLSYTATGLPAGVAISSAREVSGTPTAAGSGTATVTATDSNNATGTVTFAWTVEADTVPMFSTPVPAQAWTQDRAITAFTAPAASGGNAPLTYSVSDLPAGVVMNETTLVVSGMPTAAGTGTATVTVTDDDGDTGTLTFDWTVTTSVVPQGQLSATPNPSATGNYTVSHPSPPALPADVVTADLQRYYSYNLVETPAMGEARSYDLARGPVSQAFTGKASDTYRYQLQTCVFTVERTEFDATDTTVCTDAASALSVTVDRLPAFALEALDARTWIDGIAIAAFAVDAATGGDTPLSYAATGLPAGVTMSSAREVSGTPTGPGSGSATVTVTDEDGDTDTLTFAWAVEADTEPMFSTPVPAQTWSQDRAIAAFTVDEASGGNDPLSYAAIGLPAGVDMDPQTRQVTGTPTAAGSDTATVTVTDADGDTATLQFDWTVPMIGSGGTGTHTDPYILSDPLQVSALDIFGRLRGTGGGNTAASATYFRFTVPEGRAGEWTVAMDGTPDSRADWDLRGDGGLRSVTSNADESAQVTLTAAQVYNFRVYPYLGTDRAVLTGLSLTLTAPASTGPVFPVDPLPARTWIDGIAIAAFAVDEATGGTPPLSYTATGLPAGVAISSAREVSGTPTAAGSGTATVTATDSNNATGTVTFAWTVEADTVPMFSTPVPAQAWTQDRAITAFTAPAASGGNAPLTYSVSDLPAGVVMNETTLVVSGMPTAAGTGTATVTVTDDDGDTGTLTFDWTVTTSVVPQGQLSATPNPSATGNYTVSHPSPPALPADVVTADLQRYYSYNLVETPAMGEARSYDLARGPVSQAFTGKASDTYRYQLQTCVFTVERTEFDATDTTVCTDAASALSVTVDRLPAFALEALDARTWIDGIAIAAFAVDAATGGDTPLSYAATGLPAGVTMSSAREVSGTPTGPGSGSATVTVTDEDGDTDTLTFAWAVEADTEPMFSTPVPAQTWSQDRAIAAFTVDEASGGNDPLSYAAIGLPAGVDMDPQTRQVTGTPTAAGSDTATVTVTDADGDTATLQFDWTVPMIGSGGTGTHTDPYILSDPLQVSALDIFGRLRGTGGGNTAASATYFRFTVPEGRAGEWTVAMDGTPDSRADWDLRGDGGLRSVTSNADESAQVTLTAAQVYNFRVYPYRSADRAVLTGLTLTLTAPASTDPTCEYPAESVGPYTWIQGIAITAFTVPASSCGTPPLTYTATGLPAGVSMSTAREVSGTPTATGSGTATVTVTDDDGDTDTLTFGWTVEADTEPMFPSPGPSDQNWTQNAAITAFTVEASGGNAPLTYSVRDLPAGVVMNETTLVVSGMPTASGSDTATVTVTDADGDTATLQFAWTVPMIGSGGTGTHTDPYILSDPLQVSALDIFRRLRGTGGGNTAASATYFRFTVPEGRAGEWTVAMDGTPDSRADWDLRGDGGLRSVTSNADESAQVTLTAGQHYNFRVYPYLGTDRAVLTGLTLTLTAPASTGPVFPVDPLPARTWIDGIAIAAFTVDEATGGAAPLSYSATGLPADVTMSADRVVSGTPTSTGMGAATVTVTDSNDATDTLTFAWTVEADTVPVFSTTPPAQTWTQDRAITAFSVPAATGGNAPLAYTASGLPSGVMMSADREVTGTPTAAGMGSATVTVTVTDGDTATTTFAWTLEANTEPMFASTVLENREWTEGTAVTAFTVSAATGGNGTLTYTASGLPSGITMSSSRSVSGTATRSGSGTAVITVQDRDGDTATVRFAWAVSPGPNDLAPSFGSATIPDQSWVTGKEITPFTAPAATGGNAPLMHGINGLPSGVVMLESMQVEGTPDATGMGTATVAAQDPDGDIAKVTFNWTVSADSSPSFGSTVSNQSWTAGQTITALTVPSATGGNGTLSYGASGLPSGVTLSPSLQLSGTPLKTGSGAATVTARDADGDTATLSFTWTVDSPNPDNTGMVLSVNPNPTTSATYTVSGNYAGTLTYEYFTLTETNPSGQTRGYTPGGGMFSLTMDNRPDGVYNYELTGCYFAPVPNIPEVYEVCEPVGGALRVTVNGPDPDSVGTQLGYTFQAKVNSTNPAEATAIFIDRTSSATGAGVFQDIVLQKTGNAFQLVAPDSVAGPSSPSGWSTVTSVDLVLNDINLDGFVDILVRGLGGSGGPIAGALDQIVYAPGHRGGSVGNVRAVDSSLTDFLSEVSSWTQNPMFFEQHQAPKRIEVIVYRPVCFNDEGIRFCFSYRTLGFWYSDPQPTNLSSEAREFANQFSLVDGRINPDVSLGSSQARNLSAILQNVLGAPIFNERLDDTCPATQTIAFDSQFEIWCDNARAIGRMIIDLVTRADRAVTNTPKPGRELTAEEITLLEQYGPLESGEFRYENLRVAPRSREYFREQDASHSIAFVSPEEPDIINVRATDFEASYDDDIDMLAIVLHEIVHSCQSLCDGWEHGQHPRRGSKYVYRTVNTPLHDGFNFEVLGPDQQASYLQDRMLVNHGLPPALEGNRLKECVQTVSPPGTGCVNGEKQDVLISVVRDELNGISVPGAATVP